MWFGDASPRAIVELATLARARFRANPWPDRPRLDAPLPASRLVSVPVAALLSLHRSGRVRELALGVLEGSDDPRVLPFLLLRADDIVETIRTRAEAAVLARLRPPYDDVMARSLAIVTLLAQRVRGGKSPLVRRIHEYLARAPAALAKAADDPERAVRAAAYALRLVGEPATAVLSAALRDPSSSIRLWASRKAAAPSLPLEDKRALLPILEASASASIRLLALRARAALEPDDAALEAALLDPHRAVRELARTTLRARHPERDFGAARAHALAALARAAPARVVVGALGALADVGLRADAPRVEPLLADPRPSVRKEAARTRAWLLR